ncbi:CHAT domain-containing protein [Paractinoplanes durhamensis]|nr:CHAT domain-containing protein [Actinoplanes durhamensis]
MITAQSWEDFRREYESVWAPVLVRLGQEYGNEYFRAGPGTLAALSDLSAAIDALSEALPLIDHDDSIRGQVAGLLGWLLAARYLVHNGDPADRETGLALLDEAATQKSVSPIQAATVRLSAGQLHMSRATEALRALGPERGLSGQTLRAAGQAAGVAAQRFREVIDGPTISAEVTKMAQNLLAMAEALQPLGDGDPAHFDLGKMINIMAVLQRVQQDMQGDVKSPPKNSQDGLLGLDIGRLPEGAGPAVPTDPAGHDQLRRFLVGEMPTRVRVGEDFSLVARIVVDRPDQDAPSAAMPALAVGPAGVDVVILVQVDSGLAGTETLQATVRVPYQRGSAPVRFSLRAVREGLRRVRLSAWNGGTALAEVELEVSAEDRPVAESNQRRTSPIADLKGRAGELTMQVGFDGARYSFQIISHRFVSEPVVARSLTEAPGTAVDRTVEMLRRFATSSGGGYGSAHPYSPATARRWVEETGVGLWQDLVPDPIKEAFWELRDEIGTFTIACADDRVPWELLYPLSRTEDHGFLAQQFPVVRRVIGQLSAPKISLGAPRFVVPPRAPANADAEITRLRQILGGPPGEVISHLDELLDVLDRGPDAGMLHFACHNTFSSEGGSSITMDGGPFLPQMLNRAVTRRSLYDHHPLVFINACRSAGAAPEYTRMMSWADQFMRAGAGAFIGTLWPVNSDRAAEFAEAFYAEMAGGAQLGPATMVARAATERGGDPTWLAYSAYGDPAATAA